MDLLDEIISIAVDTKQGLPILLRKCLLLAYHLKNDRLKSWANQELNGYDAGQDLPDYRVMHVGARANFSGPFGAAMRNWPIPPAMLEDRHRGFARRVELRQAISCYETANKSNDGSMSYMWPGDLCLHYQDRLIDGYALVSAWQSVPASAISGMIDTIRNRTLNMALELKSDIPDTNNIDNETKEGPDKVSQAVTHNIFNAPAYFASGESQLNVVTSSQHTVIASGSRDDLDRVLLKSGLSRPDVRELEAAIQQDSKSIGSRAYSSLL